MFTLWGRRIRGVWSTFGFRGIYVEPTYTVDKALGVYFGTVHFGFPWSLFGLLEHCKI
jgi:hypothetical protein